MIPTYSTSEGTTHPSAIRLTPSKRPRSPVQLIGKTGVAEKAQAVFGIRLSEQLYTPASLLAHQIAGSQSPTLPRSLKKRAIDPRLPLASHQGPAPAVATSKYDSLCPIYSYDFESANEVIKHWIGDQLLKIEAHLLHSQLPIQTKIEIRDTIRRLLTLNDPKYILCELGVLYFYLNSRGTLPCMHHFGQHRLKEMEQELDLLQAQAAHLPRGTQAYALRKIANMMLDNQGKINKGGVFAVQTYLHGKLSFFFTDDHLMQIDTVIQNLLYDTEFGVAIETPLQVHPEMDFFIRVDLKMPFSNLVTSSDAQLACLLALLFDLRQLSTAPNCYAVASLIYANRTCPLKVLKKYQEYLTAGLLKLKAGVDLHFYRLFASRVTEDASLSLPLTAEDAKKSALIHVALNALGLNLTILDHLPAEIKTVKDVLFFASQQAQNVENAFLVATSVAGSFKRNALQGMVICIMEFLSANNAENVEMKRSWPILVQPLPVKKRFLQFVKEKVLLEFKLTFPDLVHKPEAKVLFSLFEQEITRLLWLQENTGYLVRKPEGPLAIRLSNEWHELPHFSGQSMELKNAIQLHRRLIYLKQNEIKTITKVSELKSFFYDVIDELKDLPESKKLKDPLIPFFKAFITVHLPELCANFFLELNTRAIPLSLQDYLDSGLLIFKSAGGSLKHPLKLFSIPTPQIASSSDHPISSMIQILNYLSSLPNKYDLKSNTKIFLCMSKIHAFLLHPYTFFPLIADQPKAVLRAKSQAPMERCLTKPISMDTRKTILLEVLPDQLIESLQPLLVSPPEMTGVEFMKRFKSNAPPDFHKEFIYALDAELMHYPCASIPWSAILARFLPPDQALIVQVFQKIPPAFAPFQRLRPFEIARLLQRILSSFGFYYLKTKLELGICEILDLPMTWALGDTNYGQSTESPAHEILMLKALPDGLHFFIREGEDEHRVDEETFKSMQRLILHVNGATR